MLTMHKISASKFASLVFPAQVTPAYFFVLLLLAYRLENQAMGLVVALLFSVAIPTVVLLYFVKIKRIDLFISDRRKRHWPFIITILSYAIGFFALLAIHSPFIVSALMLSYVINTAIAALINLFEKVSIHVWAISGPAVALFYQYGLPAFIAAIIVATLVGIARIRLKAHTPLQVLLALLVSVPLTFLAIYSVAPALLG